MTSVERILQYSHLDQEAPEHTDIKPPGDWPKDGNISLDKVSLPYPQGKQPALGPISLGINASQKVQIRKIKNTFHSSEIHPKYWCIYL